MAIRSARRRLLWARWLAGAVLLLSTPCPCEAQPRWVPHAASAVAALAPAQVNTSPGDEYVDGECSEAEKRSDFRVFLWISLVLAAVIGTASVLIQLAKAMQRGIAAWGSGHLWPVLAGLGLSYLVPRALLSVTLVDFLGLRCAQEAAPKVPGYQLLPLGAFVVSYFTAFLIVRWFRGRKGV